jgi:hypothetical protein
MNVWTLRIVALAALAAILAFVTSRTAWAQPPKLSFISGTQTDPLAEPFKPSELSSRFAEILKHKAIVVDQIDLGSVDRSRLREAMLKNDKPVFVLGPGGAAEVLFQSLDVSPRLRSSRKPGDPTVRASGISRIGSSGFYTVNIVSKIDPGLRALLLRIDAAAGRMLARANALRGGSAPSQWLDDGSKHDEDVQDPLTKGTFVQSVAIALLKDDRSAKTDWWRLRIENTVAPASSHVTVANHNEVRGIDTTDLPCWGPKDVVKPGQGARVELGCPGPKDPWTWGNGGTSIEDRALSSRHQATWVVTFPPGSEESRTAHRWQPGVQYATAATGRRQLVVRMTVFVEWAGPSGSVRWQPEPWEYFSTPPR